jgi:outer membrane protein, multidrug efflux system
MRLRPILMTSIAFCAGVVPLILGSGAGSEMRRAMGIAVFSGMVGVTLFGIFLTPVFYALLRHNTDLLQAAARVREARALQAATAAERLPALGASAGAGRNRGPDGDGGVRTANAFDLGAELRWEADLFGRLARADAAAAAGLQATEADRDGVALAVVSAVVQAWIDGRTALARLQVAQAALQTQREALRLVEARQQAGRGTALDTERARALVAGTEASVPALRQQVQAARLRLATLSGRQAEVDGAVPAEPASIASTPSAPAAGLPRMVDIDLTAVGSPEALLQRRPDLRAAELRARAAGLDVEVAQRAAWPRLTLTGVLGLDGPRLADLGGTGTRVVGLGARLVWSGLDAGRAQAQVDAAAARRDGALVAWRAAVLGALEEAELALRAAASAREQLASLEAAEQAATRAAALARARFEAGVSDFLSVLDAERERLAASDRAAAARGAGASSIVAVFRALGGGVPE